MKNLLYLLAFLLLTACDHKPAAKKPKPKVPKVEAPERREDITYTDKQLEAYLDSVGHLPTQPLADKVAFYADSVFKGQKQLDTLVSLKDLEILKRAIRKGFISVKTARRIFGNKDISFDCTVKSIFLTYKKRLIPVVFYSFNKNKNDFNEFAICVGDPGHCPNAYLYFFKFNKIIAVHNGYTRFTQEPKHYKDIDGKTVVYTVYQFSEGSGIGWFNYFFINTMERN